MRLARWIAALLATASAGCGDAESGASAPASPIPVAACVAGERQLDDGGCVTAGVPPEACGAGFRAQDFGCEPELPLGTCPSGTMALPGEVGCRPVAPCEGGPWGLTVLDASAERVDAAYAGTDSDGSEAKPWRTVQDAIDAAAPGAVVAVAPGTYDGPVVIKDRPVQLVGRCPAEVAIDGAGAPYALGVLDGADGTQIRDLAVTGTIDNAALPISGSTGVVLDRVWIHDASTLGLYLSDQLGEVEVTLRGSLIERASDIAVVILGGHLDVEASVVRDALPGAKAPGRAVDAETGASAKGRVSVSLVGSRIEGGADVAVYGLAADVTMDGCSVVGDPSAANGRGIALETGAVGTISRSTVSGVAAVGLFVAGASATLDAVTIRGTQPDAETLGLGRGVSLEDDLAGATSVLTMTRSLVSDSHEVGIADLYGDLTLELVRIQRTLSNAATGRHGYGVSATAGATATLRSCVVDDSRTSGVLVQDAALVLEETLVRSVAVQASDGGFGDGLAAVSTGVPSTAHVARSRVEAAARAGIGNFGAEVSVVDTTIVCSPIALDGETNVGRQWLFDDGGGNTCGCDASFGPCVVQTSSLTAPQPLP